MVPVVFLADSILYISNMLLHRKVGNKYWNNTELISCHLQSLLKLFKDTFLRSENLHLTSWVHSAYHMVTWPCMKYLPYQLLSETIEKKDHITHDPRNKIWEIQQHPPVWLNTSTDHQRLFWSFGLFWHYPVLQTFTNESMNSIHSAC